MSEQPITTDAPAPSPAPEPSIPPVVPTPEPTAAPESVWKMKIPDSPDTPSVFKPWVGRDLNVLGDEYHAMRKALMERDESINKSEAQIKELQTKIEEASAGNPLINPDLVSPDEFTQAAMYYQQHGKVPEEFVQAVEEKGVRIPAQYAADIMQGFKERRERFVQSASEDLGGVEWNQIEEWFRSGDSPYSAVRIQAFNEAAAEGDTSWVKGVADRFKQTFGQNGAPQMPGYFNPQQQYREGRPVSAPAPEIFETRMAARQAYADAQSTAEREAVRAKMEKSEMYFTQAGQEWPMG